MNNQDRDAVLVDTFLTSEQAQTLADWVAASGKNLTAIYVTHGHGDHFFGLVPLLERFPRARAIATPKIVEAMEQQLSPAWLDNFWRKLFPGQIPDRYRKPTGVDCYVGQTGDSATKSSGRRAQDPGK
jgi:glyoxylase-like metal-dependent hydrolase (beta-lactamase superfamily II)